MHGVGNARVPAVIVDDGILHGRYELVAQRYIECGVATHDGVEARGGFLHFVVGNGER